MANNQLAMVLAFVLGLLALTSIGGLIIWKATGDCDADGTSDLIDRDGCAGGSSAIIKAASIKSSDGTFKIDAKSTSSTLQPVDDVDVIIIGGAVDKNKNNVYTDSNDIAPPSDANTVIAVKSITLDSIYPLTHTLGKKIFLQEPNKDITARVVLNSNRKLVAEDFVVEGYWIRGKYDAGAVKHVPIDEPFLAGRVVITQLNTGDNSFVINIKVPDYYPPAQWFLFKIDMKINGESLIDGGVTAWREDETNKPKWLTLKWHRRYCNVPEDGFYEGCEVIFGSSGVDIAINSREYTRGDFGNAEIYIMTYPGKYKSVYSGKPIVGTQNDVEVTQEKTGVIRHIWIPYKFFPTVSANEAYIKISLEEDRLIGDSRVVDLDKAPDDIAARINVDVPITGGSQWDKTAEYFSVIDKLFMPFTIVGMNKHPESQWWES